MTCSTSCGGAEGAAISYWSILGSLANISYSNIVAICDDTNLSRVAELFGNSTAEEQPPRPFKLNFRERFPPMLHLRTQKNCKTVLQFEQQECVNIVSMILRTFTQFWVKVRAVTVNEQNLISNSERTSSELREIRIEAVKKPWEFVFNAE